MREKAKLLHVTEKDGEIVKVSEETFYEAGETVLRVGGLRLDVTEIVIDNPLWEKSDDAAPEWPFLTPGG